MSADGTKSEPASRSGTWVVLILLLLGIAAGTLAVWWYHSRGYRGPAQQSEGGR